MEEKKPPHSPLGGMLAGHNENENPQGEELCYGFHVRL